MAIGAVGNTIYVNQQTASVASVANSHNNRVDFQNMLSQELAQEKEKKVLEVRPAEQNHEVDPDREHEKNEADQENQRSESDEEDEENEVNEEIEENEDNQENLNNVDYEESETYTKTGEIDFNTHKLDIKV
jgi:hypothetical protein